MKHTQLLGILGFSFFAGALPGVAGDPVYPSLEVEEELTMPSFDLLRLRYEAGESRSFESSDAELKNREYTFGSFLSKPIALAGDWRAIPYFSYNQTELDFENLSAGMPLTSQDLYEVSLNSLFFRKAAGSSWAYGAWGRVRFSSDGQDVDGDDFLYDFGVGAAYQVNEGLTLGLAFVGLEVGRDSLYVPGPMVMWKPAENLSLGIMGPILISKWEVTDDWALALRGAPDGGTWNVDDEGASNNYDLSSYAIRLHTEHRLKDNLWLSLGVGYSFGGDFEVRDSSDNRIFKDDLEGGLSYSIALRLRSW
jgi:hypothetical protein